MKTFFYLRFVIFILFSEVYPNMDSACSTQNLSKLTLKPSCVFSSTESKQLMDQRSCSRVFTVAAPQSCTSLSLLPAVASCCQNFSDAVTLDFFVIHSSSASFSSFNHVYFAKHLAQTQIQCCFLPRSPSGVAFDVLLRIRALIHQPTLRPFSFKDKTLN